MEEKPAGMTGAASPASAETMSSRRRAAANKRKANALATSTSTPTSSKRPTREKSAISHVPPIHNGPLTRARQSPGNFTTSPTSVREEKIAAAAAAIEIAAAAAAEQERSKLEELEAAIEAEYEAVKSRDSNAHVVPSHCGWFSWTKVHHLEERMLPSFFNGKSQTRTPDTYMEIRNWIMKKFHLNPNAQVELTDLSELEVADLEARQEVLEFLDYWGLINFHPFPETDSVANDDGDENAKKDLFLEKLFQFEDTQQLPTVLPKHNPTTPALPSGLFPDSAMAEELVTPEYHCNSCSADCSRKRYHCQTQADYDLCADCFNNRKIGSDMSISDFILMEPAEAPGLSGGKWTDQETLLLLEALEIYKENWNEIAEHVATKTKAQCILHFVQMPIEDAFFDCDDDTDMSLKEAVDPTTTIDEISASKEAPETIEVKTDSKEDQTASSPVEISKPENANEVKTCQDTVKPDSGGEVTSSQDNLKSEDTDEGKTGEEASENIALKALKDAFEAVGYLPTPENRLSFAEVGNPVMALAAYFSRLVGPEVVAASASNSLKSLSSNSPGLQLAARHCFLLEDPPDDGTEQASIDCTASEVTDQDARKDNQEEESHKGKSKQLDSSNGTFNEKADVEKEASTVVISEKAEPGKISSDLVLPEDRSQSIANGLDETPSKLEHPPSSVIDRQGSNTAEDLDMTPALNPSEKIETNQSAIPMTIDEPSHVIKPSKDLDMVSDSLPVEKKDPLQPVNSNTVNDCLDGSKDVDMVSLELSGKNKPGKPAVPNSNVENGSINAGDLKNEIKNDHNIDKLKRAAVSTLSAAAVKAKLLANQEEEQIRQLAASLIEKQLHKLEMKLAFFDEMDTVIMRVKEQLDRSRQRLYHERAQIIAARLGMPASSSRAMPPSLPNRIAMNFANSVPRLPMGMASQRPPIARPMFTMASIPSFVPTTTAGSSIRPPVQDKFPSLGTK